MTSQNTAPTPQFATAMGLFLGGALDDDIFDAISEAGYDAMEMSGRVGRSAADVELIQRACRDHGLQITTVHVCADALTGHRQAGVDELVQQDLEFSAALGAKALVVHMSIFSEPDRLVVRHGKPYPGFTFDCDLHEWPPLLDNVRTKLDQYVQAGRKLGVAIALETDYNNSHRLIEFVEPFDPEYCGICFDTGHAEVDFGARELAQRLAPRVIATHLHDNNGKKDQHLPPFHGIVDWPGVIAALKNAGYTGRWTFETLKGDFDDLRAARTKMIELWEGA